MFGIFDWRVRFNFLLISNWRFTYDPFIYKYPGRLIVRLPLRWLHLTRTILVQHLLEAFLKHWMLYITLQLWCKFFCCCDLIFPNNDNNYYPTEVIKYDWWTLLLLWEVGWNQLERRQAFFLSTLFMSQISCRWSNTPYFWFSSFFFGMTDIKIWNVTRHRLVASGVHIKMPPSKPPPKAALWQWHFFCFETTGNLEYNTSEIHITHNAFISISREFIQKKKDRLFLSSWWSHADPSKFKWNCTSKIRFWEGWMTSS